MPFVPALLQSLLPLLNILDGLSGVVVPDAVDRIPIRVAARRRSAWTTISTRSVLLLKLLTATRSSHLRGKRHGEVLKRRYHE